MEVVRYWRLRQQRYGLVGEACPHCDYKIFPPRDICLECEGETLPDMTTYYKWLMWAKISEPKDESGFLSKTREIANKYGIIY